MTTTSQATETYRLPPLLTEQQLADRWHLNPGSLANARSAGRPPISYIRVMGRIRYKAADVLAYEAGSPAA